MSRVKHTLRQWCGQCHEFTETVPCPECGAPYYACGSCGYHHGHPMFEDD